MKGAVIALCLLGSAGLWSWALTGNSEATRLRDDLCGTFELFRFEPPAGVSASNPMSRGQSWMYEFTPEGTFTIRVIVSGGWELMRRSGVVTAEKNDYLTMTRVAENAMAADGEPERFYIVFGNDENGAYLHLTQELETGPGQQLFLRRVP